MGRYITVKEWMASGMSHAIDVAGAGKSCAGVTRCRCLHPAVTTEVERIIKPKESNMKSAIRLAVMWGAAFLTIHPAFVHATPPAGYAWTSTFSDDFNGPLDTTKWDNRSWGLASNPDMEDQAYSPEMVYTSNGNMVVKAQKETNTIWGYTRWRRAGFVTTERKFSQRYGYFEFNMKMDCGAGSWPAIWMVADNNHPNPDQTDRPPFSPAYDTGCACGTRWPPEMDFFDGRGCAENTGSAAVWWWASTYPYSAFSGFQNVGGQTGDSNHNPFTGAISPRNANFHTYGMLWKPDTLKFYIDGALFATNPIVAGSAYRLNPNTGFYWIINYAIQAKTDPKGWNATTPSPLYLYLDWVKVWQLNSGLVAPVFDLQPYSQTKNIGNDAAFDVVCSGNPTNFAYQWKKDGVSINGATSPRLTISAVSAADAGDYACVATTPAGSTTSHAATLTVHGSGNVSSNLLGYRKPQGGTSGEWPKAQYGLKFKSTCDGTITRVRCYITCLEARNGPTRREVAIWRVSNSSAVFGPMNWVLDDNNIGGWKEFVLPSPVSVSANTDYIVTVTDDTVTYMQRVAYSGNGLSGAIVSGNLYAYAGGGCVGPTGSMPANFSNANYFRDIVFVPSSQAAMQASAAPAARSAPEHRELYTLLGRRVCLSALRTENSVHYATVLVAVEKARDRPAVRLLKVVQ